MQFEESKNRKCNQNISDKFEGFNQHFSIFNKLDLLFNQYYHSIDNVINDIQDIIHAF